MAYLPQVQFQPYIKPYNGSANQELSDTVKTLTQRYDENLQAGTALDIYAGQLASQVGAGDRPEVEAKVGQIRKQLQGIVESENGYYTARPQITMLASKFKGDPDLAMMLSNREKQVKEEAMNAELRAKGQKVLNFGSNNFKTIGYDSEGKKVYNDYTPASEAMHNYHDEQTKWFDKLQADGYSGGLTQSAMQGFLQTGEFSGISGKKIEAQANRAIDGYLNTPQGNQQYRMLTSANYAGMSSTEARKAILKEMVGTGMERQFSQSRTQYMQDPAFLLEGRLAVAEAKGKKNSEGVDYPLETEKLLPSSNKDNVDAAAFYLAHPKENPYDKLTNEQKDMTKNAYNKAKSSLGPDASQVDIRREAMKFLHARTDFNAAPRYYAINGTKDINNENNTFQNGNYTARLYQDIDNPGKALNWEQLKKKLDLGDDDAKVVKSMNVSGYYHPDNPFTKGLGAGEADRFVQPIRLSITLPDGKTKTVIAGSDLGSTKTNEFKAQKLLHDIYMGDKNGRGKRISVEGRSYYIRPTGQSVQTPRGMEEAFEIADSQGQSQIWPQTKLINTIDLP